MEIFLFTDFEDGKANPLEGGKVEEMDSPPQKEAQPCRYLDPSPLRPASDFSPTDNMSVLFKATDV